MGEKYKQQLADLASELVSPAREFPPPTPHTYAHLVGELATVTTLYPDLPEVVRLYPEQPGVMGV